MKILVACEESQVVTIAMRQKGHEAYSCDIEPCSGGYPEWHIQQDVTPLINGDSSFVTLDGARHSITGNWDMLIAHPPCTYLSNAGVCFLYTSPGVINEEQYAKGLLAKEFFMLFCNAKCKKIAIENPVATRVYQLPPYSQIIQPYEHGHPYSKRTCLWLKGLPLLVPTEVIPKDKVQSTDVAGWYQRDGKNRQKNRSKTFPGIARAMAEQWG